MEAGPMFKYNPLKPHALYVQVLYQPDLDRSMFLVITTMTGVSILLVPGLEYIINLGDCCLDLVFLSSCE